MNRKTIATAAAVGLGIYLLSKKSGAAIRPTAVAPASSGGSLTATRGARPIIDLVARDDVNDFPAPDDALTAIATPDILDQVAPIMDSSTAGTATDLSLSTIDALDAVNSSGWQAGLGDFQVTDGMMYTLLGLGALYLLNNSAKEYRALRRK